MGSCRRWAAAVQEAGTYETYHVNGDEVTKHQQLEERKKQGEKLRSGFAGEEQTELEVKYSEVLSKIADAHQVDSVTVIALAYVLQKAPYVFPVVGECSPFPKDLDAISYVPLRL